ncbi:hypothetical protein [Halopenitus sp. POP-27]|nr:hypothetical protein [Halopenitus sp. POP-27]
MQTLPAFAIRHLGLRVTEVDRSPFCPAIADADADADADAADVDGAG